MRSKKLVTTILAVALVAAVGIGSTLAYFTDKGTKQNVFTMGKVDMDITEPTYPGNEDGVVEDIRPNQVIPKDPTFTIKGDSLPAYIRAKIEFTDLNETQKAELLAQIKINDGWVLNSADGYYYYQSIVEPTQKAVLFNQVQIPENWGNGLERFQINVSGEAIQADDFTPAYDEETNMINGWLDSNKVPVTAEELK